MEFLISSNKIVHEQNDNANATLSWHTRTLYISSIIVMQTIDHVYYRTPTFFTLKNLIEIVIILLLQLHSTWHYGIGHLTFFAQA